MKCYKKDYPRPQFVRDNWMNLNGTWDFGFDDGNRGEKEAWYKNFGGKKEIQVPFTYETSLSGIGQEEIHENVWYRRSFTAEDEKLSNKRLLLHFEGSDFLTKVWVNGSFAGSHRGGYSRFSFDVTGFHRHPPAQRKTALDQRKFCLLVCADNGDLENSLDGICSGDQAGQCEDNPGPDRQRGGAGI